MLVCLGVQYTQWNLQGEFWLNKACWTDAMVTTEQCLSSILKIKSGVVVCFVLPGFECDGWTAGRGDMTTASIFPKSLHPNSAKTFLDNKFTCQRTRLCSSDLPLNQRRVFFLSLCKCLTENPEPLFYLLSSCTLGGNSCIPLHPKRPKQGQGTIGLWDKTMNGWINFSLSQIFIFPVWSLLVQIPNQLADGAGEKTS